MQKKRCFNYYHWPITEQSNLNVFELTNVKLPNQEPKIERTTKATSPKVLDKVTDHMQMTHFPNSKQNIFLLHFIIMVLLLNNETYRLTVD